MRGKNILWISVIAMLFGAMTIELAVAPPAPAKLYIDPSRWPLAPDAFGHPGDEFYVAVKVEKVKDLWAAGFTIKFAPYVKTLVVSDVKEGDFLKQGGYNTYFTKTINAFKGQVKIGVTRLVTSGLPNVGASGEGTLATMKFTAIDTGESDIDIVDEALIDSNGHGIRHNVWNGYYHGTTANLINMIMLVNGEPTWTAHVGDQVAFTSKAINEGDMPLCVRTRFEVERLEDGRRFNVYSSQNYAGGGLGEPLPFTYLYVDGYRENDLLEPPGHEWYDEGDNMVGKADGNFIWADTAYALSMIYSFEDLTLAGRVIANVDLYGYTSQPDGSTGWDIDPYVLPWDAWCDSMGGTAGWAWTGGRYYKGGPYDMPEYYIGTAMHTEEGLNSAEVYLQNYCPSGPRQMIDAMRWKVEFSPITPVEPVCTPVVAYEEVDVDPFTINEVTEDMIGHYSVTATLEYTLEGLSWIDARKVRARAFSIEG